MDDVDQMKTAAATCRCGLAASSRSFRVHGQHDYSLRQPAIELLSPLMNYTFTLGCECGRRWDVDVTYKGDELISIRDCRG